MSLKSFMCEKLLRGHHTTDSDLRKLDESELTEIKVLCRICRCLCVLEKKQQITELVILSRENGKKIDEVLA